MLRKFVFKGFAHQWAEWLRPFRKGLFQFPEAVSSNGGRRPQGKLRDLPGKAIAIALDPRRPEPQIQIFCVTSVIKINFAPLLFRPRFFYLLDSVTFTLSKQISNIIHVLSLFAASGLFLSDRSDTSKNSNSTDPKNLPFSEIFITLNEAANSSPPLAWVVWELRGCLKSP